MKTITCAAFAELDHIFLVVADERTARSTMKDADLRVNYTRDHPGQGTRNICACLDNVFLELLWHDKTTVSAESEAITLGARIRGEGCPIGISWRGMSPFEDTAEGTEPYNAPFLPKGMSIPVAAASLDPMLPFVFRTPGGTPPIDRTDGLVGRRQAPELATLSHCEVSLPDPGAAEHLLAPFRQISLRQGEYALKLVLLRPDQSVGRTITWSV
ncbi:VOC family protein [Sulfitobacter sp. S190]|uniref:VOC family protein n=1 Tax=Sulfitobacter sp. S190 TaxID=2867022 RepID=UPI0021A8B01B|nr:VOC family protein [Sulfitobacter sp. S190]UWR24517.1 VOC family protein [Sulfitobacter sp. S190]